MTTKQMKKKYNQAPDSWIALWSTPIEWRNHGVWFKTSNPNFTEEFHYRLIHIKHKGILKAYLADDKVDIEFYLPYVMCTDGTELEATWEVDDNFIEHYSPELTYRLKETPMKWNGYVDIPKNNSKNNFKDYGFTGDFDGEILKEVKVGDDGIATGRYMGWIRIGNNEMFMVEWWSDGICRNYRNELGDLKDYNLTPIKKHWWNNPANFPVRLVRDTEYCTTYRWISDKDTFIKSHRQGFKLVTEDNCTLSRGMF